jgi:mannosyltransferase
MARRRTLIFVTLLTLLAFGLRVLSLDTQSMWRDEVDVLCFAFDFWETLERAMGPDRPAPTPAPDHPRCLPTPGLSQVNPAEGLLPTLRALLTLPGWNGSLYTVAIRPWIGLTGHSAFALRYGALFFGLLAVPLTYVLGRRLLSVGGGLLGATLVALSPHLVWYSQEVKMYGAILALGSLAVYGLRRAVDEASQVSKDFRSLKWWAVAVGATTLALYCHVLAALLIPLQVILGLIWWPRTRRHWRGALVALGCLTLPYLPLLAWQARNWLLPARQATLFTVARLDVMLEATFNGWGGNFVGEPWARLILVALLLLALGGLIRDRLVDRGIESGDRDKDSWREPAALLAWALLPLLGIWLISARQPIFTNRYLVWAAPGFYLLAAAGAVALARLGRGGALIAGGLLAVVWVGDVQALRYQATEPIKPDFRAAADYVENHYQPGDLVIFHLSHVQQNFDFYFEGDYDGWGAPAPGQNMSETDLDFYMRTNTSGHGTLWLVLSEPQMWDPRGLVKAWLDGHAVAPPEVGGFVHVSVYQYTMSNK